MPRHPWVELIPQFGEPLRYFCGQLCRSRTRRLNLTPGIGKLSKSPLGLLVPAAVDVEFALASGEDHQGIVGIDDVCCLNLGHGAASNAATRARSDFNSATR